MRALRRFGPAGVGTLVAVTLLCGVAVPARAVIITEFPVPAAPWLIAAGPDGNLWFTEFGANKIGKITPAGVVTEYGIPTANSQPFGITAGPDGNLWFTELNANRIGKITPGGVVTEYVIPTPNSQPFAITAGPDGNVWFTEVNANNVGRITPAGIITEFSVPSGGPGYITLGPDGNLWFTETDANKIGQVTPAGVVTEFPIPTARSGLSGIAPGSDGALWFTEANANKIGRITTAGVITSEFSIPTAGSVPFAIVTGPDGALWFTEANANQIGRITTAGAIAEFAVPTVGSGLLGIVLGPDGVLAFTETAAHKIGRISTLAAAVLPLSRSVQVGAAPATAFAAIINVGVTSAPKCAPAPPSTPPAGLGTFNYQTTTAANVLSGTPNTPADIAPGDTQHYVFGFSPTASIPETSLAMRFLCDSTAPALPTPGVNNLFIVADTAPVPDTIALIATVSGDGVVHIPGSAGTQLFAIGTSNVGATGTIVVSGDTGGAALPLTLTVCETTGGSVCLTPPTPTVTVTYTGGTNRSFAFFAQASGSIAFNPANNRVFARLRQSGVLRGATSAAVCTTPNAGC